MPLAFGARQSSDARRGRRLVFAGAETKYKPRLLVSIEDDDADRAPTVADVLALLYRSGNADTRERAGEASVGASYDTLYHSGEEL